jgi:hypothetical protein
MVIPSVHQAESCGKWKIVVCPHPLRYINKRDLLKLGLYRQRDRQRVHVSLLADSPGSHVSGALLNSESRMKCVLAM